MFSIVINDLNVLMNRDSSCSNKKNGEEDRTINISENFELSALPQHIAGTFNNHINYTSGSVMVNKLDLQTFTSEFDSH